MVSIQGGLYTFRLDPSAANIYTMTIKCLNIMFHYYALSCNPVIEITSLEMFCIPDESS